MLKMSLKLVESRSDISKLIIAALDKDIDIYFSLLEKNIRAKLGPKLKEHIQNSETYRALDNELLAELGMVEPYPGSTRMDNIIDHWINNVVINLEHKSIEINYIPSDYEDAFNLPDATFITPEHQYSLPWLKWLLTFGDREAISGFSIKYKDGAGRHDLAIMIEKGNWKVPSKYSGTKAENFVTQSIDNAIAEIKDIIKQIAQETVVP